MFREKYDFYLQPTTSKGYWVRDFSVWPIRSEPFRSGPFRSGRFGLSRLRLGRFGLGTFRSDYETLQKSYMLTF